MFSESQTLLDTTTYFRSSLYNLKVALALLSALQKWDGTVRVPFFPVAVFSKHCVCAQLVKEELSKSAVWLLLLSWECQSSCSFTDPSFIKTASSTCALGSSVLCLHFWARQQTLAGLEEPLLVCVSALSGTPTSGQSPSAQSTSCQLLANGSSTERRTLTKGISTLQITRFIKWIWFGNTPSTYTSRAFL